MAKLTINPLTGNFDLLGSGGGGSGANTALSNLASVAINTTLVSDTDSTDDLGTSSIFWKDLYVDNVVGPTVFNEAGADVDFRFEGDTDQNLLFTDASTDRVGIGIASPAQKLDVAGSITLSEQVILQENASIALDPAGSADGKYTGTTITGTAGYTQAFGDLVYLDPTDSRWEAADANAAAGADGDSRGMLGMVVVAGTDGTACTILLNGIIMDAAFWTRELSPAESL